MIIDLETLHTITIKDNSLTLEFDNITIVAQCKLDGKHADTRCWAYNLTADNEPVTGISAHIDRRLPENYDSLDYDNRCKRFASAPVRSVTLAFQDQTVQFLVQRQDPVAHNYKYTKGATDGK